MPAVIEFSHPALGAVRGLTSGSTNQFLGLQYATLAGRWDPPVMAEGAGTYVDGTKFGPTAPSFPDAVQIEFAHIQMRLPVPDLRQSETECLNLNITTPADITPASNLPVIIFLHGGGYAIGSNSWPQYDFKRIVALSIAENRPIIGVNVNYRLGVLGFLASRELESHGYQANNGLHDQRTALLWIRNNIAGFGGDPEQITLVGESAGGVSATHHLQSELPLFKRLMSMGGTNLLMQPLAPQVTELTYKTIVDRLGLGALSPTERVDALVQMDTQKLFSAVLPGDTLIPSLGGVVGVKHHMYTEIYQGTAGSLDLPGRDWCHNIIVGDCQLDASVLSMMIKQSTVKIASSFKESLRRSLGSADKAGRVLSAYSITEDISDDQAMKAILRFASDICFFVPVLNYGHRWSGHAFIYQFNEPNTWDGPWKGYANHILDVAYLFQNYNEHLPEPQRGVAIQFAKDVVAFANGVAPWAVFKWETGALNSRVYGGRDASTSGTVVTVPGPDPRTERANTILTLMASIPADDLAKAWGAFMAGF